LLELKRPALMQSWVQVPRCWQGWTVRASVRSGRGCPRPDTESASASRPTAGHSWAQQPPRWGLWENSFKEGRNTGQQLGSCSQTTSTNHRHITHKSRGY